MQGHGRADAGIHQLRKVWLERRDIRGSAKVGIRSNAYSIRETSNYSNESSVVASSRIDSVKGRFSRTNREVKGFTSSSL